MSRYPIATSEVYDLPRCQRRLDPRILLRAEITAPDGPIQIFSAHTATGDDCQLQRVGELFREHQGTGRAILMGDLNTESNPRSSPDGKKEPGLIDVFRAAIQVYQVEPSGKISTLIGPPPIVASILFSSWTKARGVLPLCTQARWPLTNQADSRMVMRSAIRPPRRGGRD